MNSENNTEVNATTVEKYTQPYKRLHTEKRAYTCTHYGKDFVEGIKKKKKKRRHTEDMFPNRRYFVAHADQYCRNRAM